MKQTCCIGFALLTYLALSPVSAETIYGEDLTWMLAKPSEIRQITNIRATLRKESKTGTPLFVLTPPPFGDIAAAPNELGNIAVQPKSWELPPWPAVDPALPENTSPETRKLLEERRNQGAPSEIWSELEPAGGLEHAPSILLRPRVVPLDEQFVYRIKEIPEPFSLRRYYDREDVFVEVAAYGGTTSYKAEEAFRALKEAATRQQLLEGVGEEAFLTRVEIKDESEREDPNALPFADLAPKGEQRPDLMDSGSAAALLAPAFQDLPVKDLEGRSITYVEPHKKYRPSTPEVEQSYLVIVAFFPDQALTVSLAIEERLGTVQDLIAVAMMVQRKVRNELRRG